MTSAGFRFERFTLDPVDRQLRRDGAPVELTARYFDALTLMVRDAGKLVSKERFMDEVWRGIPVTDEALTQCIRTLRRQLGDDASSPRFIETVPKHGYRFVAPVDADLGTTPERSPTFGWRELLLLGAGGTVGGGIAGFLGGLIYGFAGATQPLQAGIGAASILLVILSLTIVVGLVGGAGVAFGIAAAGFARPRAWAIVGGALGGLLVGAAVKLLGLDAFNLLLGHSPGDITGPFEGLFLGTGVGLGACLAATWGASLRRSAAMAAATSGAAGLLICLLGGRLMGGSLELLAHSFPGSRLRLGHLGSLFGESGFGPVSQAVTGMLEGALFGGCVVGAMVLARRSLTRLAP